MELITVDYEVYAPLVEEGMRAIAKKTGETVSFIQLLGKIQDGRLRCFVSEDLQGFVLLYVTEDFLSGEPVLNILAAYHREKDAIKTYDPLLIEMAEDIGATSIEFKTKRESLCRYAKRFNYEHRYYELTKRI